MSSVIKGIKKVFKKVGKFVKKALPIILAVAAVVFTAGAALGATGVFAAGWGGAATSIGTAIGGSGTLGAALGGAITQAGYGALIGGVVSEASGGSFTKGAQAGAITGAVTGGLSGAYGHLKNLKAAEAGLPTSGMKPTPNPDSVQTYALQDPVPIAGQHIDAAGNAINAGNTVANQVANTAVDKVSNPGAGGLFRGLFGKDGWVQNNQELVGGVVKGIGQGLAAGGAADAERDLLRERQRIVSENYAGTDPGRNYSSLAAGGGMAPRDRFDPSYYGSFEYRYNPETARIERVPVGG